MVTKFSEKYLENYKWKVSVSARNHLDYLVESIGEDIEITDHEDGTSLIEAYMKDLPEVYGFIIRLRDALVNFHLLQVTRIEIDDAGHQLS